MDLDGAFSIATDGFRLFDTSSDGAIVLKEMGKALGQVDIETLQARMGEADVDERLRHLPRVSCVSLPAHTTCASELPS